jgi:hypothetical protein
MTNWTRTITSLGILALFAGCSSSPSERVDVRGPYPDVGRGNAEGNLNPGTLVVYTPVTADLSSGRSWLNGSDEAPPIVYSGYTVYSPEGKRVEYVRNHSLLPSTDEPPSEVALAPGRYLIKPDSAGPRSGQFWVSVEAQKETRVDVGKIGEPALPQVR